MTADRFSHDARSSAEDNGMPGMRLVTVPVEEYYKRRITREEVAPVAAGAIDALIDALVSPLAPLEAHGGVETKREAKTIRITAEEYDLALEKFNQLFLDNHWGSGLPLVPPTPGRVEWMLSGTSRSRDEVIGTVAPKNGIATIEGIAINSVMAGARPEYLPVIIAAMEGLTDRRYDLLHMMASTGSFTLQIIVTGPIAEEIGMNADIGLLGHGWRSNNTIGHAVRLCLTNIGLSWPRENDMAVMGRPWPHTFLTFAENHAKSPWPPYHTSVGFEADDELRHRCDDDDPQLSRRHDHFRRWGGRDMDAPEHPRPHNRRYPPRPVEHDHLAGRNSHTEPPKAQYLSPAGRGPGAFSPRLHAAELAAIPLRPCPHTLRGPLGGREALHSEAHRRRRDTAKLSRHLRRRTQARGKHADPEQSGGLPHYGGRGDSRVLLRDLLLLHAALCGNIDPDEEDPWGRADGGGQVRGGKAASKGSGAASSAKQVST